MSKKDDSMRILKKVVVDGLIFVIFTILIIWTDKYLEPFHRGFFCGDESIMYPYRGETVSATVLKAVGLSMPAFFIVLCEYLTLRHVTDEVRCLRVRIPAWARGAYCTLASFFLGYCFIETTANIAKCVIGRPRPHFIYMCQPTVDCAAAEWRGRYIEGSDYTCTGDMTDKFRDMRKSFLSGHSIMSAYTMLYLALYLEKRMTWRGTRVLRHTLQFLVVMLSWFTALSRISDYMHHWSDVLAGYCLGVVAAVLMWIWGTDLMAARAPARPAPAAHDVISLNGHHQAPV